MLTASAALAAVFIEVNRNAVTQKSIN